MTLSEQIRAKLREADAAGLSPFRMAALIGVTPQTMTRFMRGEGGLELANLDRIGELLAFKVTMSKAAARKLAADAPRPGRPAKKGR